MTISAISATPAGVTTSRRMSRQRTRDTEPEMLLRRELHRRGLRYRVDASLPGLPRRRADVLFTRARVAVFVDGCFWHGCPEHKTAPNINGAWWAAKLARNIERDRETDAHLSSLGWTVLRFWEHGDIAHAATDIEVVVRHGRLRPANADIPGPNRSR
ncbi:very short patch repair endonuclease [Mycobacteroides salmoniphilum]|uniref:very short patch repair endonuclease n=1 Tax=Mycobacteroides salmoniphilum TaxID=404941 RepID=UPI0010F12025|nr:very short patch repair endonuclease [Mycobacteroides salmoniphilum]TDZ95022.1 Very short patch repair protein [Mycobacteroides salmoniphilum]